jgi:hypothetical protein
MIYDIYYMRPDWFREGSFGALPDVASLERTHAYLTTVEEDTLDAVYSYMQAHHWAQDYRVTNALLESKGLCHTSMSVGDVIKASGGQYWVVADVGFKKLEG